jgi:trehalose 6-phosphate synthase/phosphatase
LWPLFHYSIDRVAMDAGDWATYQEVNRVFADAVAREYRPGDTIWIHDYHLMLLPALLRERLPEARIGFFLHIPFPSSEVFRLLPWRQDILKGLLGADLIGFHTFAYMRHFMTSLLHVAGVEPDIDRVRIGEREARVGVFPMGIDAGGFNALARDPLVRARAEAIRREAAGRRIVLGVDRLDYTKGIPERLEALSRLFEREGGLRDGIRYIQVAVPSRGDIDTYQQFRRQVEERVGRVNGVYGTPDSLPVHYMHQSVDPRELVALYSAADVMLVTPLRDGMNLVAKEFAASRVDEDGVLVLSEFAGAAAELQGALTLNPFDVNAMADTIRRGLSMPVEERRARMRALRHQVCRNDVYAWADAFVHALHAAHPHRSPIARTLSEPSLSAVVKDAHRAPNIRLLIDYERTVMPPTRSSALTPPDDELLSLLEHLTFSPGIRVDILSGRPREALERWFSHLPIALWAEQGLWHRGPQSDVWIPAMPVPPEWMARVKPILDQLAASTPGALVEMKTASMAWHYHAAPRDFGARQAHELRLLLGDLLSNQPIEVLERRKVIEVRMRGASQALVSERLHAEAGADDVLVVIGNGRSDHDLFRALPADVVSVSVGDPAGAARFRVHDHHAVRRLLRSLVDQRESFEAQYLGEAVSA